MTDNAPQRPIDPPARDDAAADAALHQPRLWRDNGWTAQVIKNNDDEGWAVAMYRAGQSDPALVGPWTMGRDKKTPKPLSTDAFNTLVKTASEVIRRHEQHLHATLHPQITVDADGERVLVSLDIVPDDDAPSATLSAQDSAGELLGRVPVSPGFKLNRASATAWVEAGFQRPK